MFLTPTNWGRSSSHILFTWVLSYALTHSPNWASAVCPTAAQKVNSSKIELRIILPQGLEFITLQPTPILDPSLKEKFYQDITWLICALLKHTIPNHNRRPEKGALLCMTLICHSFLESSTTDCTTGVGDKSCMRRLAIRIQNLCLLAGRGMGCDQPGTHGSVNKGQRTNLWWEVQTMETHPKGSHLHCHSPWDLITAFCDSVSSFQGWK